MAPALWTLVVLAGYALIEAFYVLRGEPTITWRARTLNARYPSVGALVCLALGVLPGHLYLQ